MEKEKEPEKKREQFKIAEIEDDTKKIILELANNSLNKGGDGRNDFNTDKDIANYIKRELENRGKGSWHVIVGTSINRKEFRCNCELRKEELPVFLHWTKGIPRIQNCTRVTQPI